MRKILLSIILLFAAISSAIAQKLTVESFKLASSDLTAQTQPRKDRRILGIYAPRQPYAQGEAR